MKYFLPPYTEEDIQKQYKAWAKKMHPDKGGSEKQFKELNEEKKVVLAFVKSLKPGMKLKGRNVFLIKARPRRFVRKRMNVRPVYKFVFDFNGLVDFIRTVKKL